MTNSLTLQTEGQAFSISLGTAISPLQYIECQCLLREVDTAHLMSSCQETPGPMSMVLCCIQHIGLHLCFTGQGLWDFEIWVQKFIEVDRCGVYTIEIWLIPSDIATLLQQNIIFSHNNDFLCYTNTHTHINRQQSQQQ